MEILFVTDYACPCRIVAKEGRKEALAKMGIDARISWHPFELTPEDSPWGSFFRRTCLRQKRLRIMNEKTVRL